MVYYNCAKKPRYIWN